MTGIKVRRIKLKEAKELGIDSWNRWNCEPDQFDWEYPEEETAYFYEGDVIITTPHETIQLTGGMLVTFPKGLKCHWNVRERIEKVYTFHFDMGAIDN
ncbi:cupin domain-containing protein [Alkaliphilus crotonatoxidans]